MSGASGLLERLLPPVDQLGADGEPKPSRMDRREQLVAAGLGLANIVVSGAMVSTMKDQRGLVLAAGLASSVVTLVGARMGNRLLAMGGLFLSVLTRSSSTGLSFAFGVPYYGAAFWMFLRYNRLVKAQAALRRQQRSEGKGGRPAPTSAGRSPAKGGAASTKARPNASKRYTPPKPVKKRPPPPSKPPRDRSIVD